MGGTRSVVREGVLTGRHEPARYVRLTQLSGLFGYSDGFVRATVRLKHTGSAVEAVGCEAHDSEVQLRRCSGM